MRTARRLLLVSAALAMGAGIASASTIVTETFTFGPGGAYDYSLANPVGVAQTFYATLHRFNDSLLNPGDQLQNVAFFVSVHNSATAQAENGSTNPNDIKYVYTIGGLVPVNVLGPAGMNTTATPQAIVNYGNTPGQQVRSLYYGPGCYIIGGCPSQNDLTVTGLVADVVSSTNVAQGQFGAYHDATGSAFTDQISITVGPAGLVGLGDPGVQYSSSSTISGSLTVEYTYENVPEPMTTAMVGGGLLLCAIAIRRKRAAR